MRLTALMCLATCFTLAMSACGSSRYAHMETRVHEPISNRPYQVTVDRDFDALEIHPDYFTPQRMRPVVDDITKFW